MEEKRDECLARKEREKHSAVLRMLMGYDFVDGSRKRTSEMTRGDGQWE